MILKSEGLGNIEKRLENGQWELKQSAQNVFRGADEIEVRAKLEFYDEVTSKCARTKFKCPIERQIMEMYCDGIPQQQIKRDLERMGISRHRMTIVHIIRKYLILFGLHGK